MSGVSREYISDFAECYFPPYQQGLPPRALSAPTPVANGSAGTPSSASASPASASDNIGTPTNQEDYTPEETASSPSVDPSVAALSSTMVCDIIVDKTIQRMEQEKLDQMHMVLKEKSLPGDVLPADAPTWQLRKRTNARLRFLRARKHDIDAAVEMYEKALAWRAEVGADTILDTPDPLEGVYQCCCSHRNHGVDREGHPLYFEKSGAVRMNEFLAHLTEDDLVRRHIRQMEYAFTRALASSKVQQRNVEKIVMIHDLANLQFSVDTSALRVFKRTTRIDQDYYPERLHRMVFINAPLSFRGLWAVIRPWIDPKTAAKVIIVGKHYQDKLREFIPLDQLPLEYGGTCRCRYANGDGCMPPHRVHPDATATPAWYDIRTPPSDADDMPVQEAAVEGAASPADEKKKAGWFSWGRK